MPEADNYRSGTLEGALAFFDGKVGLPTKAWDDLWQGMHARAFVIAGATQEGLLVDMQKAVSDAIKNGTTLTDFRKAFDQTVQKHGWSYKGKRGWRTGVIFNTNLRTAYAAGRYKQQQRLVKQRPYLIYRHGDTRNPRPQHLAWDGLVLPQDDPFWDNHTPPNGWGCQCKTFAVGKRDLEALGKSGPGTAPVETLKKHTQVVQGRKVTQLVPEGIDPEWNYNVGKAAWGSKLAQQTLAKGERQWERLTAGYWKKFGRPEKVQLETPVAKRGALAKTTDEAQRMIEDAIGGPEKQFSFQGDGWLVPINVNAEWLAKHVELNRSPFIPFLPELLENPYEVWQAFQRDRRTGKVVLRTRLIKPISDEKGRAIMMVLDAYGGQMSSLTFFPTSDKNEINKWRVGRLLFGR